MPRRIPIKQFQQAYSYLNQATIKINQQKYSSAKQFLSITLHIFPHLSNALYLYSICLEKQGLASEAKILRSKAYNLNQLFFEQAQQNVGKVVNTVQNLHKTIVRYLPALQDSTGRDWLNLIDSHLRAKDFNTCDHIMNLFEKIKKNPQYYSDQNLSNIGVKYFQLACYKKSIDQHLLALAKSPTDVMYNNNLSILHYALGEYATSLQYAEKTVQLEPGRVKAYYIQSFILIKLGRVEDGIKMAEYAASKEPSEILFKVKVIINMMLFGGQKAQIIQKRLKETTDMLQKGGKTKQYFSAEENFPKMIGFLNENLHNLKENRIASEEWHEYLLLFDDYLVHGLRDKLKIHKRMTDLSNKIVQKLITSQSKGQNPEKCEQNPEPSASTID